MAGEKSDREQKVERIRELVELLRKASRAYYMEDREIMSNFDYDKLYDELESLEKETGFVMSQSPTRRVGYEVVSELPKEKHPAPMLSLDKTKEVDQLISWLGDQKGLLSWKMDGLTIVLTYRDGKLEKAVTRGNGEVGEVITANARAFRNLPGEISCKDELVIRGEAVISYADFDEINARIPEEGDRYRNPRNLCSGSVRQLDSRITAERNVSFYAFSMVEPENKALLASFENSMENEFRFLSEQGFQVVEWMPVTAETLRSAVRTFADRLPDNPFPSDGLVLDLDDLAYGKSLGITAKFPRDAIAFKWKDEEAETVLRDVEWSASRTGRINPVAVFDPVWLEGTEVKRASLHNLTYIEEMKLGIGDRIKVYKANMIIPQLSENMTRSGGLPVPGTCPVCGEKTVIRTDGAAAVLYCGNPDCAAKNIKRFTHFVSRNAMNIEGLSEATLEKFINLGYLKELPDLFHLERFRDEIVGQDGFGEQSFRNLKDAVERAREADPAAFLYGLGIPNVGLSNARMILRHFSGNLEEVLSAKEEELCKIAGVGDVIARTFVSFLQDERNMAEIRRLMQELTFPEQEETGEQDLAGMTFVITGSLSTYPNRDALVAEIVSRGGKAAGSVSKNTSFLINNDVNSTSGKNKKARELGVPIISEEDFRDGGFLSDRKETT